MQKTTCCVLIFIALLANNAACFSQNISFLNGNWKGKSYLPGSIATQLYDLVLDIYFIKGNKFEGIIKTVQPSDTSIHFDSRVEGEVNSNYLTIDRNKILYLKNAPGVAWVTSCNNCKPPHMFFSIEKGKFYFRGEQTDCYKACNGVFEFSKDITAFDSSATEALIAFVNNDQKALIAEVLPAKKALIIKDTTVATMQENSLATARITLTPGDTIVVLKHKPAVVLVTANISSLQRISPSFHIDGSIQKPVRLAILPAGSIAVTKHRKAIAIIQKQPGSLQRTNPCLKVKENALAVIPHKLPATTDSIVAKTTTKDSSVIAATVIPLVVKHDSIPPLPQGFAERKVNVIKTLEVNTDSITLRVYDNGVVDGDIVSVIYNDQVIVDKLSLTSHALIIKIPVDISRTNTLVFHAHNLGEFPPNTARLEIIYGSKTEALTVASDFTVSSAINILFKK